MARGGQVAARARAAGGATDPTSHFAKIETPGTDPTGQLLKIHSPGTDPTSPLIKITPPGTDAPSFGQADLGPVQMPGSQVMLNPQPLPPGGNAGISGNLSWSGMGDGSVRPQGPSSFGEGGAQTESAGGGAAGRGLLGAIIAVLLIALIGDGLALKFKGSFIALSLRPGVIVRTVGGIPNGVVRFPDPTDPPKWYGPSEFGACASGHTSGMEEEIVGDGYVHHPDDEFTVPEVYPGTNQNDPHGFASVIFDYRTSKTPPIEPTGSAAYTAVATCLRAGDATFAGANALVSVNAVQQVTLPTVTPLEVVSVGASCPTGDAILGGGYDWAPVGQSNPNTADPLWSAFSVDASYPVLEGSTGTWHVTFRRHSNAPPTTRWHYP